jgi:hypothetical protein
MVHSPSLRDNMTPFSIIRIVHRVIHLLALSLLKVVATMRVPHIPKFQSEQTQYLARPLSSHISPRNPRPLRPRPTTARTDRTRRHRRPTLSTLIQTMACLSKVFFMRPRLVHQPVFHPRLA